MALITNTYDPPNGDHNHTISYSGGASYNDWPIRPSTHGSITYYGTTTTTFTFPKENTMSTAEKIRQERKERKERERIEALYEVWEQIDFTDAELLTFDWTSPNSGKTYRYAAVSTEAGWYLTGPTGPNGISTEQLIDWFVEKNLAPVDINWYLS